MQTWSASFFDTTKKKLQKKTDKLHYRYTTKKKKLNYRKKKLNYKKLYYKKKYFYYKKKYHPPQITPQVTLYGNSHPQITPISLIHPKSQTNEGGSG